MNRKYIFVACVVGLLASMAYGAITTQEKYLLNHWGHVGREVQLGTLIENAEDLSANSVGSTELDQGQVSIDFTRNGAAFCGNGTFGQPLSAQGAVNCIESKLVHLEWYNDLQQDLGIRWVSGSGLNIAGDQTNNDALQIAAGNTASELAKTVGTDNFYVRAKVKIEDVSGTNDLYIGLRKVQTYGTTPGNYDDFYAVGFNTKANPGAIKIRSNLSDAGAVVTDTTQTLADTQYLDVKIYVGEEAQLQTSIDLANALKTIMNTHYADATEHTAGTQELISTADASSYLTAIALTTDMMESYRLHEIDATATSGWSYHIAATSDDDSLASFTAPTTLATMVTRLNDLKAKLNLHVADNTAHTDGDSGTTSQINASTTYLQLGVNGAVADPTVGYPFDFTSGESIMPFIYLLQEDDLTGYVYLQNFEVVDTTTSTSN